MIATDFSAGAKHAAEYGYTLARQLKTNVVLCNAFIVPAQVPERGVLVWPRYEYDELLNDSAVELKELEQYLEGTARHEEFKPLITRINDDGPVQNVINQTIIKENIELLVMGAHGNTGLSGVVMGNHSRRMIDEAACPLLLVPSMAFVEPVKKVAFATDFKEPEKDIEAIFKLIPMLRRLSAELLLTHIYDEIDEVYDFKKHIESFLLELSNKANYPHIYYRIVKSDKPEKGLDWLCRFGNVDMLAMVHRKHSFFDKLLKVSHTQKMADHISVPLLVIPGDK